MIKSDELPGRQPGQEGAGHSRGEGSWQSSKPVDVDLALALRQAQGLAGLG